MPITVKGLDKINSEFAKFRFAGPRVQKRFLKLVGDNTVQLLRDNTPRDTGELANSWQILTLSKDKVEVGTRFIELARDIEEGTPPHVIEPKNGDVLRFEIGGQEVFTTKVNHPGTAPNTYIADVARTVHNSVISALDLALSENHPYFAKLKGVGGKGRKFQQVGRSSAGFNGGVSFSGRSTLVRAGTGRKQLKRRLSLRRRKGSRAKTKRETTVKLG